MREYRFRRDALPRPAFEALRHALVESPLVGGTTLNGPFEASRGFAVVFKDAGRAQLVERFPALAPWLDATLGAPAIRALTPWWRRTLRRIPNAWYLNLLLVSRGGTVGAHVDATLRKPSGVDDAVPELVSVLYLSVPRARGGELVLWNDDGLRRAKLAPRENASVHFRGDLLHEVLAFDGADGVRASLVIEQYHFAPEPLARLPDFKLDSRAGFQAYLAHHATRARASFELED